MDAVDSTALGLEVAWLEDEVDTIATFVQFLEQWNFVVHVTDDTDEVQRWVARNGYDVLLADLEIAGPQRSGVDLIREIDASPQKRIPIVPVSQYLDTDMGHSLPPGARAVAIDKGQLDSEEGRESARKRILEVGGGGRIRVVERAFGFVKEDLNDSLVMRLKLPNGQRVDRRMWKLELRRVAIGEPTRFVEVTTAERIRGSGVIIETHFRWIPEPPLR